MPRKMGGSSCYHCGYGPRHRVHTSKERTVKLKGRWCYVHPFSTGPYLWSETQPEQAYD